MLKDRDVNKDLKDLRKSSVAENIENLQFAYVVVLLAFIVIVVPLTLVSVLFKLEVMMMPIVGLVAAAILALLAAEIKFGRKT